MKKILSTTLALLLVLTTVCSVSLSAQAAVRYDSDNAALYSGSGYTWLNIRGQQSYKGAFDALAKINSTRTGNAAATVPMDQELLDAAMLRAKEAYVYYNVDYRPNGESAYVVCDGSGVQRGGFVMVKTSVLDGAFAANYLMENSSDLLNVYISPEVQAFGVGCFKPADENWYYWVFFHGMSAPTKTVKFSDYAATVTRTDKIALKNTNAASWNAKHTHSYQVTSTVKANATKNANGKITRKCSVCSKTTTSTLYAPKTVTLSAASYTYDGKVKKPSVTVKDSKGNKIGSQYYTVSYPSGRKNVGKYTVKVTFKGNYIGSKSATFAIKPKGTSVAKVTAAKKGFKVTWKKQATQTTGYEVQYSTASNFKKGNKTVTVSKNKTTSKSVSKLSAKKKYYVRVRTYKTVKVNGKNVKLYSGWSKAKSVTTKK